jgi:DNA-binding MarR family transcriptional regulator
MFHAEPEDKGTEVMLHDTTGTSLASILRETIIVLVRSDTADLSARQLAVFLTCYLAPRPQTVRGLATDLNVPKPGICRALGRLEYLKLVRRKADPMDRRSVFVQRTSAGAAYLTRLRGAIAAAGAQVITEASRRAEVDTIAQIKERRRG